LEENESMVANETQSVVRPGEWLVESLGLSLACVGLGFRDGNSATKFLNQIDTRSEEEMLNWDDQSISSWLRRNPETVPNFLRDSKYLDFRNVLPSDTNFSNRDAQNIDWAIVGPWGPGESPNPARLYRVQGLYILTRLINHEMSAHAAFSFMIGSNRELLDHSPLTWISRYCPNRFEATLVAAHRYLSFGARPFEDWPVAELESRSRT
jgi:hypothetical protein